MTADLVRCSATLAAKDGDADVLWLREVTTQCQLWDERILVPSSLTQLGCKAMTGLSLVPFMYVLGSSASPTLSGRSAIPFSPGFDISAVLSLAVSLPSHSWEFGTASEALLELYDAPYSVYGEKPFPIPWLSPSPHSRVYSPALDYAKQNIVIGTPPNGLSDGDGAVGDPASLGVVALLLGVGDEKYRVAAEEEIDYLLEGAPRWHNGAVSHRAAYAELWADFIYMAPPFLAYYGAAMSNATVLRAAVEQCRLYHQVLLTNTTSPAYSPAKQPQSTAGLWVHIVGPENADPGLWSTGNAWAAAGMMRVLATVLKAGSTLSSSWRHTAIADLTRMITDILDAAIRLQPQVQIEGYGGGGKDKGLLRNYLDDETWFGEISGSTLLASVAYRLVSTPGISLSKKDTRRYIAFAESIRLLLGERDAEGEGMYVSKNGTVAPAVNPLGWGDRTPYTAGSPEGQNFVVLMYAAWRDWKQNQ
ncbi:unnamed protein product [Cyclocybe aegerita]|uniref:Uncharacterized protein n=1 Tax=Cyclocybe aegerita TaxID=1973307 RepID=A0A8S0WXI5_CYCAE|nr:unnamed protein product [Cyclocybe aegerita]